MPTNQKKRFARGRAILNRLPAAPDTLTLPEVEFYTGASLRAIRLWVKLWIAQGLIGPAKVAWQVAGSGSAWQVNKKPFVLWLIARKHVRFAREYGFPSQEEAEATLGGYSGAPKTP